LTAGDQARHPAPRGAGDRCILGGRLAINGGGLAGGRGKINYWGRDTLQWQPIGHGHTDLVHWSMTNSVDAFYAT
jgi:hypothetical protein